MFKTLKLEKQEKILLADWLFETRRKPLRTCWHQRQIHTSVAVNTRRYGTHKGRARRNIEFLVLVRACRLLHHQSMHIFSYTVHAFLLVSQPASPNRKDFRKRSKGLNKVSGRGNKRGCCIR